MNAVTNIIQLFKFLVVFGIDRFQILEAADEKVRAVVGWPDEGQPNYDAEEETQEVCWDVQNLPCIDDALLLLELAYKNEKFDSDKFLLTKEELRELSGWDLGRFENALRDLLLIKVDMVDDGEKTDSYFVHF